jgi:flavin reductase (DIM6/NTAB) family NADH-FMN oxidoreductase RutF
MTQIDPRALRSAFGTFMTGVTVVTALDHNNAPVGFTANSFTSVSLDPPLLLVCLAKSSSNYSTLTESTGFAVNVLAEGQIDLSNTFARPSEDRFADVPWTPGPFGAPILSGVTAWFDCSLHKVVDGGDHVILMGEVQHFDATPTPGLGYARGAYVTAATAADAMRAGTNLVVTALIEHDGQILLVEDGEGGLALPEADSAGQSVADTLEHVLDSTGLRAEAGFVYSVYEDSVRKRQHIVFMCQTARSDPALGRFYPLQPASFDDVSDPALLSVLTRYASEHSMGQFGLYVGNREAGQIRPIYSRK